MAKSAKTTKEAAVPRAPKKTVIRPVIQEMGKRHALEDLFNGPESEMPEMKSVGYGKIPGTTQWVSYVITTKGKEVIDVEVTEPDHRAIAEDAAKTSFVTVLMDKGL